MNADAVDGFAGPGGWSEGLRLLGLSDIGVEHDHAACMTRVAVGHLTIEADMSSYPPEVFKGITGGIFSPPCTDFSRAGKRQGLGGATGGLVFEVVRWVDAIRPQWVACEQVPDVLPIWRQIARQLEEWGYRTWCGLLSSERYGVPQTRLRAILMAHRDHAVTPPSPTHQEYVSGQPARWDDGGMFGDAIRPWVSMAEALGWDAGSRVRDSFGSPSPDYPGRTESRWKGVDRPSPVITSKTDDWVVRTGTNSATKGPGQRTDDWRAEHKPYERSVDAPAPTVDAKAGGAWTLHTNRGQDENGNRQQVQDNRPAPAPAPALTAKAGGQWAWDRPSTTIVGSFCPDIVAAPGYRTQVSRQDAEGSVKITLQEALILQSFRSDYPVAGTKTKQFQQVGNAIPPLLAAAIIGELTGIDWRGSLWEAA